MAVRIRMKMMGRKHRPYFRIVAIDSRQPRDGRIIEVTLPSRLLVGGADTSAAAAKLGLGLVQAPRYRFLDDLASGALVEVLADFPPAPMPLSVLYPSNRQLSPRVRVFIDWLVETIGSRLLGTS